MSEIEGVGNQLDAVVNHLSNTRLSLTEAKKEYGASADLLGEVLARHELAVKPYIKPAANTYENGVDHLRAGLKVFTEKVMPALEKAGIQNIKDKGEDIYEHMRKTNILFNDILKFVLEDFFRGEVFKKQQSMVDEAMASIREEHDSLTQGVLAEDSPLDAATTHIGLCIVAINNYRQSEL